MTPALFGIGIWLAFPTAAAFQDMTSFVSGLETGSGRWGAVVEQAQAGSIQQAELPFVDATVTGAIAGAGFKVPGLGTVALRSQDGEKNIRPDEDRVNRTGKQGRLLKIAPVSPPKFFNAGSILERTSSLHDVEPEFAMAFVKPEIEGKELDIALAFHPTHRPIENDMPIVLASLVTNEKADILATAYAPAAPNYATASPFASLLKGEDPSDGRFIPPMAPGDHAWMKMPLPPHVFSDKEQKCLAEGIYFEARGEEVKGQAAVAQVILNRVRAPAYPNTICGVVYQNRTWRNRCQFSFACDGTKPRVTSAPHYKLASDVAMAVTAGKIFLPEVGSSTHYHATYVSPRWARTMDKVKKIGLHIFYRTKGGGWS
ncbi:cell wall hydrolase [Mesorhizobium sp. YIM 152430]|jgi:spore germination cell wall hydrolase CwlJ-like protein|uniref:cell wall hydrolase n=1 Tax=Mesorhizobium sp. YIM 152430 TaxID=3031761 RepID=UPI0023D9F465|nr:cell wall hydrolase [Mesorhizobium sp. YIM 152430]MDF1599589.1 cell wall hydrolase [Mesorhizobium sp. YIM 152430]